MRNVVKFRGNAVSLKSNAVKSKVSAVWLKENVACVNSALSYKDGILGFNAESLMQSL